MFHRYGLHLQKSKDPLKQSFLEARQRWVNRINKGFKRRKIPDNYRATMRQSVTFFTVQAVSAATFWLNGGILAPGALEAEIGIWKIGDWNLKIGNWNLEFEI